MVYVIYIAAAVAVGLLIGFVDEQRGVAPGQSAVLYEPDAERGDRPPRRDHQQGQADEREQARQDDGGQRVPRPLLPPCRAASPSGQYKSSSFP
mgnify:CR=1 FL=1